MYDKNWRLGVKMKKYLLLVTFVYANLSSAQNFFYEVPTKKPHLKKFAKFKARKPKVKRESDKLEISYALPNQLTGFQLGKLKFQGNVNSDNTAKLSGKMGHMNCETESYNCEVKFNKNYQDFLKVMRPVLFAKVISQAKRSRMKKKDLDAKIEVLNSFIDDPRGTFFQY